LLSILKVGLGVVVVPPPWPPPPPPPPPPGTKAAVDNVAISIIMKMLIFKSGDLKLKFLAKSPKFIIFFII
jgi:hypothetical protein